MSRFPQMPRPQVYYYSRVAPPLPGGPPPRLARPQTAASASLFVCKAVARLGGEPARVCAALPGLLGAVPPAPTTPRGPVPYGGGGARCGGRGARACWPRAHGAASRRFLPSKQSGSAVAARLGRWLLASSIRISSLFTSTLAEERGGGGRRWVGERGGERGVEIDLKEERDTRHTLLERARKAGNLSPPFLRLHFLEVKRVGVLFPFPPSPPPFSSSTPFPSPLSCLSSMMPFFIHICVSGVERRESEQGAGLLSVSIYHSHPQRGALLSLLCRLIPCLCS